MENDIYKVTEEFEKTLVDNTGIPYVVTEIYREFKLIINL
jgi:hypothetical protein